MRTIDILIPHEDSNVTFNAYIHNTVQYRFFEHRIFRTPDFSNYFVGPLGVRKIEVELYMFLLPHLHTTFCSNMFKLYEKNHNFYADTLPKKLNNLISVNLQTLMPLSFLISIRFHFE